MKTSIATVSLSGDLRDKLEAIAAAGFDGVEIFENDFLSFDAAPREVGRVGGDAGRTRRGPSPPAGFDGVEIFENDFLSFDAAPREVGRMVRDAGLVVTTF